jgi:hypothetical protein
MIITSFSDSSLQIVYTLDPCLKLLFEYGKLHGSWSPGIVLGQSDASAMRAKRIFTASVMSRTFPDVGQGSSHEPKCRLIFPPLRPSGLAFSLDISQTPWTMLLHPGILYTFAMIHVYCHARLSGLRPCAVTLSGYNEPLYSQRYLGVRVFSMLLVLADYSQK